MKSLFVDTDAQSVQEAVHAFNENHGIPRMPTAEQEISTRIVSLAKGMDLTPSQYRHVATVVLNDEKRIQSGKATSERKSEIATARIAELKGMLRTTSTARVLQFVHGLNAYLAAHHPDLHAVLRENDARGGSLGSEPTIVKHLARQYQAHQGATDRAARSAKWPDRKQAEQVSRDVPAGGVLSGHVPANSVVARQRELDRSHAAYVRSVHALQASDPAAGPANVRDLK